MKYQYFIILALLSCTQFANSQDSLNLSLVSNVALDETVNDIWGWVDTATQIEYAIVGSTSRTTIFSLEDPTNPVEMERYPGPRSVWRDMKTYGDYAYSITDAAVAPIVVIDMRAMVNGDSVAYGFVPEYRGRQYEDCHNVYIDEKGRLYIAGGNLNSGGVIAFDLTQDPINPPIDKVLDNVYAHDVYARNDLVFTSDVYAGELSIFDISGDEAVKLSATTTSGVFTHNAWLNTEGDVIYTTDEIKGGYVDAYDVSDPEDVKYLDKYRTNTNAGTIPHNAHNLNDYAVTSWYTDGVVILDASVPSRLTNVGHYDTYPVPGADGFSGCWGAYPFLPSGLVLASDRQNGLFVLEPNYVRSSHLDITYIDAISGEVIPELSIQSIVNDDTSSIKTDLFGRIELDYVGGQNVILLNDTTEYYMNETSINAYETLLTGHVVELLPKDSTDEISLYTLGGNGNLADSAFYVLEINNRSESAVYLGSTYKDTLISIVPQNVDTVTYHSISWTNHHSIMYENQDILKFRNFFFSYEDPFIADYSWNIQKSSDSIVVDRIQSQKMLPTPHSLSPLRDAEDLGNYYMGMQVDLYDPEKTDLDMGEYYSITSPPIFTGFGPSTIDNFIISFYVNQMLPDGNQLEDNLSVLVLSEDYTDTLYSESINSENIQEWNKVEIEAKALFIDYQMVRVQVIAQNNNIDSGLVYINIDNFSVTYDVIGSANETFNTTDITIYPNPISDILNFSSSDATFKAHEYKVFNMNGQVMQTGKLNGREYINTTELVPGAYILQLSQESDIKKYTSKFIKQ